MRRMGRMRQIIFGELDQGSFGGVAFPLQLVDFLGEIICPARPIRPTGLIFMC